MGFEELFHVSVTRALSRLLGGQQGSALMDGSDADLRDVYGNPTSDEIGLRGVF